MAAKAQFQCVINCFAILWLWRELAREDVVKAKEGNKAETESSQGSFMTG